ncbi:MAG: FtsW/RodA/SpoVE family cell cycle protein, partial [Phormidesmis sp.]
LLAIGSGGGGGTGYGLSAQKLYFLPIQYTDFIFSVFAEEFGFIGCLMLLLFLAVYSTVALMVAIQAKRSVHRLVAIGCMVLLVGQSLVNIGVATGVLPTTGLPFPMFSYGGSSMIASLITAGVLIRVARESHGAQVITLGPPPPSPLPPQRSAPQEPARSIKARRPKRTAPAKSTPTRPPLARPPSAKSTPRGR